MHHRSDHEINMYDNNLQKHIKFKPQPPNRIIQSASDLLSVNEMHFKSNHRIHILDNNLQNHTNINK